MNCRDVRNDLALLAGGDLEDRSRISELRQHITHCPDCRNHFRSLRTSLKTLSTVGAMAPASSATWESQGSLWPSIRQELVKPPASITTALVFKHVKHWTPFTAMTVACLLVLTAINQFGRQGDPAAVHRGVNMSPPIVIPPAEKDRSESERSQDHTPTLPTSTPRSR